jgi:hypothetical protein
MVGSAAHNLIEEQSGITALNLGAEIAEADVDAYFAPLNGGELRLP